jgi:hypothetical protein
MKQRIIMVVDRNGTDRQADSEAGAKVETISNMPKLAHPKIGACTTIGEIMRSGEMYLTDQIAFPFGFEVTGSRLSRIV